jgi:hypothetical protein
VLCGKNGLRRVDDPWQIHYRRAKRHLETSPAHAAVTICLASDDAEIITGVSIAQPGTASRWRREMQFYTFDETTYPGIPDHVGPASKLINYTISWWARRRSSPTSCKSDNPSCA